MESVLYRNIHLAELVHDIAWRHRLKTVILNGFPVKFRILALSAVSRTAFDDRSVQLVYQISDQFG